MESVIKAAVCEDNPEDAAWQTSCIEQTGIPTETESFDSAEALLELFTAGRYDLICLDIYMSGETGIHASQVIRETDKNVCLAFTTTSLDHALESYRVGAVKYLEKPVKVEGVKELLELALMKKKNRSSINLATAGGGQENILLDAILYFEQQNHNVEVHISSGALTVARSVRLDELEKELPSPPFIRPHHSFIVNLDYAQKMDKERQAFIMKNGHLAYIRRGMFGKCEEAFRLRIMKLVERYDA